MQEGSGQAGLMGQGQWYDGQQGEVLVLPVGGNNPMECPRLGEEGRESAQREKTRGCWSTVAKYESR